MHRSRTVGWLCLLATFATAAVACGSDSKATSTSRSVTEVTVPGSTAGQGGDLTTTSAAADAPVAGGDLVIARSVDVKQLDPVAAVETATIHSLDMIMETLLISNDKGGTSPLLAESVTPAADGLTWTVVLRKGVTFSNGSPLTSADVKFSLDRARSSDQGFAYMLAPISAVNVVDDLDLTIVTSTKVAYLPALLALWTGAIIPKDFAGKAEADFFTAPIGTGPFMYDSWTPGGDMKVVRNPTYWEAGKPYVNSVTWTVVADDSARVTQLQGGQAEIIEAPFSAIDQLGSASGVSVDEFPSLLNQFLMFNLNKPPFQDVHVRTAIAHALDKASMRDAALFGRGDVACSILPPSIAYYSSKVACTAFDLAAAKAELAKSSVPTGFTTTLLISSDTSAVTIAQIIVEDLKPLGIDVTIQQVDPSQLYDTQSKGDYDMIYQGWASDIPDPDEQLTFMLDPTAGGVESYWTFYNSPDAIAMVTAARAELDATARAALYAKLQDLEAVDLPHIPLVFQPWLWATTAAVHDFHVLPTGNYRLQDVWLKT